ncbi:3-dehydroquinate synthase [Urechidicola vernalis]|uniref:3-dehydroquinate synthase n=1 Tax=Urechidicola vernalis TaxID=3075600 RepID=A0ABU2Y2Z5_9FLAO|nr:3-dehydroquinate synthase [Urechidicola sp. P050]MDT0552014.1 3-dehydroquinate synthase [Urechidicola sp. P050]
MNSIFSDNYYVHFNEKCYTELNNYISENKPSKVFVLVDENTEEHCYPLFIAKLETTSAIEVIEIESGEENKNLDTCTSLWNVLTDLGADRKSLLINVGGGVITDMGGFVASTFKRGISFINVPTTLLSMVDASVGGKTGVDLGVLKNQIGVFSNPEMVLVDTLYLQTVSSRELTSGMAEILKYGLTYDAKLWGEIIQCNYLNISSKHEIIYRSIEIKNEVVKEDPKEGGLRKILNFGHTLGHAIESHHLESEHLKTLTHGEAIAIGMITEAYLSHKLLGLPKATLNNVKNSIVAIFDKVEINSNEYSAILELLKHDKKNDSGQVNFVLLEDLEKFKLNCVVPENLLIESLEFYKK